MPGTESTADWRALGTGVRLVLLDGDLAAARAAVERVLDEADRSFSRFRPDSSLVRLNAGTDRRPDGWTPVPPLLGRALAGSLAAARRSGGALDPTVGHAMRVIGYDLDFDLVRDSTRPLEVRIAPVPGWTAVTLDLAAGAVRLPLGTELDLGATGKGLAADLAAATALEAAGDGAGVLVSLGGDIATAGCAPDGGWRVRVADDSAADPVGGDRAAAPGASTTVAINGGAVATSSTTVRRWRAADGVTRHHIVDPRTGLPAETPWRTVTVAAATAEEANGVSTAAIVLGGQAPAWLAALGLPARLVANSGAVTALNGWPAATLPAGRVA